MTPQFDHMEENVKKIKKRKEKKNKDSNDIPLVMCVSKTAQTLRLSFLTKQSVHIEQVINRISYQVVKGLLVVKHKPKTCCGRVCVRAIM